MRRRRVPRRTDRLGGEVGVLPLINIVFLLLIFFMLAGQFAAQGPVPIRPTESASETEPGEPAPVVAVGPDGTILVADRPAGLDDLADLLAATADARSAVWLKADAGAEAVQVIDVLQTIREAGFADVRLLTVLRR